MIRTFDSRTPWGSNNDINSIAIKLLLFIIWPFGALLLSLRSIGSRSSYVILFLFSVLLCWHMTPYNTLQYDDFLGILDRFNETNISFAHLCNDIKKYFTFQHDAPKDIYESALICFVKAFTKNYHVFFFIASVPVALSQLACLRRLTSDVRFLNGTIVGLALVIMFIFPRDIITVQNPRFVTGFWLCCLGSLIFYCDKSRFRGLLLLCLGPLCHSGLLLYLILFVLFILIPKKIRVLELLALLSIPFLFFEANLMEAINVEILPSGLQIWANKYLSDEAYSRFILDEGRSGFWWVQAFFETIVKLSYVIMTIQLIRSRKDVENNEEANLLYPFYLFIFIIVSLIQFIPVLGFRYFWFVRIFCLFVWFKAFGFTKRRILYLLVFGCSFLMLQRYGYILGGALSVTTPPDLFITPLPYLIFSCL